MKRQYLKCLCFLLVIVSLLSCALSKPNQKPLREKAASLGLVENQNPKLDVSFFAPQKPLKNYSTLFIEPLNFSEVKIVRSSSGTVFDTPWELNDKDRAYYQEKFANAAKENLFSSGSFRLSEDAKNTDLILKTKLIEIAPLASKDDFKGRPTSQKVYSEGFGTMTVVFEFYDAKTNELVATLMDEHELGRIWEENNRIQNNIQIKLAFEYWMNTLVKELTSQTKS